MQAKDPPSVNVKKKPKTSNFTSCFGLILQLQLNNQLRTSKKLNRAAHKAILMLVRNKA
jgi:hypothetical protein